MLFKAHSVGGCCQIEVMTESDMHVTLLRRVNAARPDQHIASVPFLATLC